MRKVIPQIVHQEPDFVIVNKPSGMLSIPDRYNIAKPNMQSWLKTKLNQDIFTVHRLDFETSGLLIFALNAETHKYFNQLFQTNNIQKSYLAVVEGRPEDSREIDLNIRQNPSGRGMMETHVSGKNAFTSYKKMEQYKGLALLEVSIKTGRTHQIRVHLSSIGYPILMDTRYGSNKVFTLKDIKTKFNGEGKPMINRLALHAHHISFIHPKKQENFSITSTISKDFEICLKQLRKWG